MIQSAGKFPLAGANEKKGERSAEKADTQREKVENRRRKSVFNANSTSMGITNREEMGRRWQETRATEVTLQPRLFWV
jgi:hypothetical protein